MQKYFNSLQVFLAAAFSLVVFIGVLWVEQSNFAKLSALVDPFEKAQLINERIVVQGESPKSWLHTTGELFMLFPGSKINFINQSRELEEGVVFLNSNFQHESEINKAKNGFVAPFDFSYKNLSGGQISAGPIVISVPQGIAVISRDLVRQETEVYAYDHPIDIYLPEAEAPFLLPARHTALIDEKSAKVLGSLYFSKFKKEVNLRPLQSTTVGVETVQSALLQGLEQTSLWETEIVNYAEKLVLSWDRFAPSSFMGSFFRALEHIQRYYALGIDKPYKALYQYGVLKKDLEQAYFSLEDRKKSDALVASNSFLEQINTSTWARFFVEQPFYLTQWNNFVRTQRVWFYAAFPDTSEAVVLKKLWGPQSEINALEDFVDNYYLFEKYYAQNFRIQAQNQLAFLNEAFENLSSENLEAATLTRLRRQLAFLLDADVALRNETSVLLYAKIIEAEGIALGSRSKASEEIRLEVSLELLFFLEDMLDSSSRQDMAIILLRSYRNLKVSELYANLGRGAFNARARAVLDKIGSLGSLSDDKLKAIKDSNRAAADALALFDELNTTVEPVTVAGPIGVQTEEAFIESLDDIKVLVQGMSFSLKEQGENKVMTFGQAMFEGYSLQGTFQSETQSFSFLKLGEVTENRATISSLAGFLNQMLVANKRLEKETNVTTSSSGPNNYTSGAIVQRRNILNLLKKQGINVSFENVLLTNDALTKARIENASFEKQYSLDFDFDLGPPVRVRNVTVEYGRSTILLAGQAFTLDNLSDNLLSAIEAKLVEQESENEEG